MLRWLLLFSFHQALARHSLLHVPVAGRPQPAGRGRRGELFSPSLTRSHERDLMYQNGRTCDSESICTSPKESPREPKTDPLAALGSSAKTVPNGRLKSRPRGQERQPLCDSALSFTTRLEWPMVSIRAESSSAAKGSKSGHVGVKRARGLPRSRRRPGRRQAWRSSEGIYMTGRARSTCNSCLGRHAKLQACFRTCTIRKARAKHTAPLTTFLSSIYAILGPVRSVARKLSDAGASLDRT